MNIYLLEDNIISALYIKTVLHRAGHVVVEHSRTFEDAKYFFSKTSDKIDIAILDVMLDNGKSGVDVAEIINKKFDYLIPILFMTGLSRDEEFLESAKKQNYKGIIDKPATVSDLLEKIEKFSEINKI